MKYQLLPLDPDLDPVDFDTQSILDLARLGPYDKDAGVVYFDGVACLEPRPDKTTMSHVRRLEAELLAMKVERDRLLNIIGSAVMNNNGAIVPEIGESYLLIHSNDWAAMGEALVAAAKGES